MSDTRSRLAGINHVALEVRDIDEAVAFYESLFEIELRGRTDTKAFLDMGDQFLALEEVAGAENEVDAHRHVGIVVDDRESLRSRLETLDIDPLDRPGLEIRDPWGNRLQFVAYEDVQFTKADHVLAGMELTDLRKSAAAIDELAAKGMAPPQ